MVEVVRGVCAQPAGGSAEVGGWGKGCKGKQSEARQILGGVEEEVKSMEHA